MKTANLLSICFILLFSSVIAFADSTSWIGAEFVVDQSSTTNAQDAWTGSAFNGSNYIVVWCGGNDDGSYDAFASRVDQSGGVLDSRIRLTTQSVGSIFNVSVASDGTNFLATWDGPTGESFYRRIKADGTLPDAAPVSFGTDTATPRVAFGTTNYLVLLQTDISKYPARLEAITISTDGVAGLRTFITNITSSHSGGNLAFNRTNFFAVWADDALYATRLNPSGSMIDSNIVTLASGQFHRPSITSNGKDAFAVWSPSFTTDFFSIFGARLDSDGALIDSSSLILESNGYVNVYPVVAFDGNNYVASWMMFGVADQPPYVLGACVVSENGYQLTNVIVPTDLPYAYMPSIVAGGTGKLLLTSSSPTAGRILDTTRFIETPVITQQPINVVATEGTAASFVVTAVGGSPLQYQWRKGGTNILGATSSGFTIANCSLADAGVFSVFVSNPSGSIVSSNASLTVNARPSITAQPIARTNDLGTTAIFTVAATGTAPLSFTWLKNGAPVTSTNATGTATATLTISNVTTNDGGSYSVVLENGFGTATSSGALLTVNTDLRNPTITMAFPGAAQRVFDDLHVTNGILAMRGTALDNVRVASVWYTINNSEWQLATGTSNWMANVTVVPGTNTAVVKSIDQAGKQSLPLKRTFFYVVTNQLSLIISGSGSVLTYTNSIITNGTWLEVGRSYLYKELPASGNLFKDWSGDASSTAASLSFVMRSNFVLRANFVTNRCIRAAGAYAGLFTKQIGLFKSGRALRHSP